MILVIVLFISYTSNQLDVFEILVVLPFENFRSNLDLNVFNELSVGLLTV